jgi:hypothetical protein
LRSASATYSGNIDARPGERLPGEQQGPQAPVITLAVMKYTALPAAPPADHHEHGQAA